MMFKTSAGALLSSAMLLVGSTQAPSLRDVLERAGRYVVSYGDALATVIAHETYLQQLVSSAGAVTRERRLESEVAFVKLAGSSEWQALREVLRVDGQSLDDAPGRLERLLRDAPGSILSQARLLAAESARYNLGALQRNFNVPTTALQFIHPEHQERFRFRKLREERIDGGSVWVVGFEERRRATLIRTPDGSDVPVAGHFWIDPIDGCVLRSAFKTRTIKSEIDVTWTFDPHLGLWVPAEMRERYEGRSSGSMPEDAIVGVASYSDFRRFDVQVRIRNR